jgi:hypothetical protein
MSTRLHPYGGIDGVAGALRHGCTMPGAEDFDSRCSRRRRQLRRATRKMEGSARRRDSVGAESGVSTRIGVDDPIDYEKTRFEDVVHDVDVVLDTGWRHPEPFVEGAEEGRDSRFDCLSSFARGSCQARRALGFPPAHPSSSQLSGIAKLVDAGKLKAVVETVLSLSDARRAHELNETGHARGKILLKVA